MIKYHFEIFIINQQDQLNLEKAEALSLDIESKLKAKSETEIALA